MPKKKLTKEELKRGILERGEHLRSDNDLRPRTPLEQEVWNERRAILSDTSNIEVKKYPKLRLDYKEEAKMPKKKSIKKVDIDSLASDFGVTPLSRIKGKKSIRRPEDVERIKQDWENRTALRANRVKLKAAVGSILDTSSAGRIKDSSRPEELKKVRGG